MTPKCSDHDDCGVKPARGSKRRKLWDLSGLECSIVGTCLTRDDLQKLTRKLGLKPSSDAEPYEIHAYFVGKAGEDGAISRAMHKLL